MAENNAANAAPRPPVPARWRQNVSRRSPHRSSRPRGRQVDDRQENEQGRDDHSRNDHDRQHFGDVHVRAPGLPREKRRDIPRPPLGADESRSGQESDYPSQHRCRSNRVRHDFRVAERFIECADDVALSTPEEILRRGPTFSSLEGFGLLERGTLAVLDLDPRASSGRLDVRVGLHEIDDPGGHDPNDGGEQPDAEKPPAACPADLGSDEADHFSSSPVSSRKTASRLISSARSSVR